MQRGMHSVVVNIKSFPIQHRAAEIRTLKWRRGGKERRRLLLEVGIEEETEEGRKGRPTRGRISFEKGHQLICFVFVLRCKRA